MCVDRRDFLRFAGLSVAGAMFAGEANAHDNETEFHSNLNIPEPIRQLKPMTAGIVPIA